MSTHKYCLTYEVMVWFASQLGGATVPGAAWAPSDKHKALQKLACCSYDIVESSGITIYQHVQDFVMDFTVEGMKADMVLDKG